MVLNFVCKLIDRALDECYERSASDIEDSCEICHDGISTSRMGLASRPSKSHLHLVCSLQLRSCPHGMRLFKEHPFGVVS